MGEWLPWAVAGGCIVGTAIMGIALFVEKRRNNTPTKALLADAQGLAKAKREEADKAVAEALSSAQSEIEEYRKRVEDEVNREHDDDFDITGRHRN